MLSIRPFPTVASLGAAAPCPQGREGAAPRSQVYCSRLEEVNGGVAAAHSSAAALLAGKGESVQETVKEMRLLS